MAIKIVLDASDLQALYEQEMPEGVWLRTVQLTGTPSGVPEVELLGQRQVVENFIQENWGQEELDRLLWLDIEARLQVDHDGPDEWEDGEDDV